MKGFDVLCIEPCQYELFFATKETIQLQIFLKICLYHGEIADKRLVLIIALNNAF